MKKLSRIILLVILALVMIIPAACTIMPEKGDHGIIYEYDILNDSYVVVDFKADIDEVIVDRVNYKIVVPEVEIPATYNGKPVTKIKAGAFRQKYSSTRYDYGKYMSFNSKENYSYENLINPNNNVDIAYYAKIQKIIIPSSIQVIEDYAFYSCSELTTVVLDNGISEIGNSVFAACVNLKDIVLQENGEDLTNAKPNQLPAGITKVSDGLFYNCLALDEVYLPSTVNEIGMLAFSNCTALETLTIEKNDGSDFVMLGQNESVLESDKEGVNITKIGSYAFKDSIAMKYFNIPNSVTVIEDGIFEMPEVTAAEKEEKGSKLVGVSFSEHIRNLGAGMFKNCVSLDENKLDLSNVETMGEGIFEGCTSLTSIQLNDKITVIPKNAYKGCTGITHIDITKYTYEDEQGNIQVGNTNIQVIGEGAFRGCSSLRLVELGSDTGNLIQINRYAFRDCASLRSIYIPKTVYMIEPRVFENAGGTTVYYKYYEITPPAGKEKVIADGFANGAANYIDSFQDLIKVKVGDKVIAEYVVKNNKAYLARYVDFDNASYSIPTKVNGINVVGVMKAAFKNCDKIELIEFETVNGASNVNSLESEAFANASALKTIDLSKINVKAIPEKAFFNSKELVSVTLPTVATSIENSAFEGCSSLVTANFSNISTLGKAVFKDCSSLKSITLGQVKKFTEQAFYKAVELDEIIVASPNAVTTIEKRAFAGCIALDESKFDIGNLTALSAIGDEAFLDCKGFTKFTFPASLKTVGAKVFTGCEGLKEFEIAEGNKDFFVDSANVLYKKKTQEFNVRYFLTKSDFESSSKTYSQVKVAHTYYSELVFYPANSSATELNINMYNVCTVADIFNYVETKIGKSVYAISGTEKTLFTINNVYSQNTYWAADGNYYKYNTSTKLPTLEGSWGGANDYILGTIGSPSIANYAFDGAINLEKVTLYGNIKLGIGIFNNCEKLEIVEIKKVSNADKYYTDADGVLYNGTYDVETSEFIPTQLVQFPAGYQADRYVMPDTVTSVGDNAFAMVKRINTLVLSKNLGLKANESDNLVKAFNKSNIGAFELNANAGWVDIPTRTETGTTYTPALKMLNEEDKYIHVQTKKNEAGQDIIVDGVVQYEELDLDVQEIYKSSNGKIILDNFGILYYAKLATKGVNIDGKDVSISYIDYYQLIYVPSDIDLSDKTLTIPDGCTVSAYAFTGNPTLTSIELGAKVSMVPYSFDNCSSLKNIYYQSSPVAFEDNGFNDEKNFIDNSGYATNLDFKNADVYYFSKDIIASEDYIYWGYESALDDETQAQLEYDMSVDSAVPEELDGQVVFYQNNDLRENYGFQYQLAKKYNEETEQDEYYKDQYGNWAFETNNFGEKQFIFKFWNKD